MDTSWPPAAGSRNSNTVIRGLATHGPGQMTYSPNDNSRFGKDANGRTSGQAGFSPDYHTYAMAVDFYAPNGSAQWHERMRDFAKWLYDHYSSYLLELIHTTPFSTDNGFYVKRGQKVGSTYYGNPADPNSVAGEHVDHVHVAMDKPTAQALLAKLATPGTAAPSSTPAPAGHMYLIDLASYQAGINLQAVKDAGFRAVNVKLGQGNSYSWATKNHVHDAKDYIDQARTLGLGVSVFYWIDNSASGATQADRALDLLRSYAGGTDGVAFQCDNEDSATWAITRDFTNAMQDGLGRHIAMYTGDWWAASHGPSWDVASLTPYLWAPPNAGYLSSYPGDTSSHWDANYWGYSKLSIMQYAVSGISGSGVGNVSKSYIRDMSVWAALTGGDDVELSDKVQLPDWAVNRPGWEDLKSDGGKRAVSVLLGSGYGQARVAADGVVALDKRVDEVEARIGTAEGNIKAAVAALASAVAAPVDGLTPDMVLDRLEKTLRDIVAKGSTEGTT